MHLYLHPTCPAPLKRSPVWKPVNHVCWLQRSLSGRHLTSRLFRLCYSSSSPSRWRSVHSLMRRLAMACFGGSQQTEGPPLLGGVFTCRAEVISSRLNQRASSSSVRSTFSWTTNSTAGQVTHRYLLAAEAPQCSLVFSSQDFYIIFTCLVSKNC